MSDTPAQVTPLFPENLQDYAAWVATRGLLAPYGKCQCGCGKDASIASKPRRAWGYKKGEPTRFYRSHGSAIFRDTPLPVSENVLVRTIPLTKGKVAIVDASDYDMLSAWRWGARQGTNTWYAERSTGHGTTFRMHRIILGVTDPAILVDHIDGDGLNNTRANLRMATKQQNVCNTHTRRKGSSEYIGVSFHKDTGKFQAAIGSNGTQHYLGLFQSAKEAAIARDKAARELHGEFATLNFEEDECQC